MNLALAHQFLLRWFSQYGRSLPWREKKEAMGQLASWTVRDQAQVWFTSAERDPYCVLVAELMLQQTQVDRVIPKYLHFLRQWPTVEKLANASLADVLVAWQGLGYNRRAKYLHGAAKVVWEQFGGVFPRTEAELLSLPGVGKYTARALLVFGMRQPYGVLDTNIQRVLSRAWLGGESAQFTPAELWELADSSIPPQQADPWSQALMDLGATVCVRGTPKCSVCPLQSLCVVNRQAQEHGYADYAVCRAAHPSASIPKVKPALRFEETDRYFRGRVVDRLRNGAVGMDALWQHIHHNHGLADKMRWGRIVEQLVADGLIEVRGTTVQLAGQAV